MLVVSKARFHARTVLCSVFQSKYNGLTKRNFSRIQFGTEPCESQGSVHFRAQARGIF